MASISIKDLAESVDLDREAMAAISGGARSRGPLPFAAQAPRPGKSIVDYPPGIKATGPRAGGTEAGGKRAK